MAKTQIAVFSAKPYDKAYLSEANEAHAHDLVFLEARLDKGTAVLAIGKPVVSIFVNDDASADVLPNSYREGPGSSRFARRGSITSTSMPCWPDRTSFGGPRRRRDYPEHSHCRSGDLG